MAEIVAQHARGRCRDGDDAALAGKDVNDPAVILRDNSVSTTLVPSYLSPPSEQSKVALQRC